MQWDVQAPCYKIRPRVAGLRSYGAAVPVRSACTPCSAAAAMAAASVAAAAAAAELCVRRRSTMSACAAQARSRSASPARATHAPQA